MAKKVEIEIDVNDKALEGSIAQLKELKKQLKNTAAGSEEFKKIYNQIDDLEDKIKSAKNTSSDWVDSLQNAGGPLGMVGAAINKVKVATVSWGAALKATGIGLLVALIGGLVAAFSQTEGSLKKLQPLLIGMEKIFGGIVAALGPVIDGILDLGLKALPFVTEGFRVAYSAMSSFLQGIGKIGQAVMRLIKGDFVGAWESAKDAVTGFGKRYDEASKNFIKGTKEMTKTEKENAKLRQEAAEKAAAAAQKALDEKLKRMEAEDKLDEAKLERMKAEALALAVTEQQKLDVETAFAKKSYDLKKQELEDKQKLYKKDSVEYKGLQAEKIKLEADYITQTTANKAKQKELTDKANKEIFDAEIEAINLKKAQGTITEDEYQKALYDTKKKYYKDGKDLIDAEIAYLNYQTEQKKKKAEQDRAILFQSLQDQIDVLDRKNSRYDNDFLDDQARLEERKTLLQQQRDIELAAAENDAVKQLEIKKKYADAIYNTEVELTNNQKAQIQARIELQNMYADAVAQFGALLQQVAGKNKALAKTGLIIEQAAGVAKIIINTQAAAAKIAATSPLGFLDPRAILTYVMGGISVATAVAATVKGIRAIDAADQGGSGGGSGTESATPMANSAAALGKNYGDGGMINGPRHAAGGTLINAEGGEAVMTRGAVTMFGPLLSTLNQMGGGTSFAPNALTTRPDSPSLERPEQQPIIMKSYVVSSELTTDQHKQARLKDLSTL